MTEEAVQAPTATQGVTDEAAARAAKRLTRFAGAHGGAKFVYVEYLTAFRSRVVVVGQDGRYGDQVVDSHEIAMRACELAGFEVLSGEWEREAVGAVRTTGFEWGLMAHGRPADK